jgi:soluble lytic murein transglycosylase-like protein
MAASFGELLSGAGRIGRRAEQVGQELRDYDRDRAALDELRRQQAYQAQVSQLGLASQMAGAAPGAATMIPGVQFGQPPVPEVAAPAAPAVPASALPAQARPGAPDQSAAESARLARSGLAMGDRPYQSPAGFTPPAGMTGPQNMALLQQERLRRFAAPEIARQETAGMNEQERFAELQRLNAPAAQPAQPTQPTKKAQQYDNKTTPYDAIIQQSAAQYGLDPVVFKRLIGTESSFSPTAVSPRGEKFGLGIAQIAAVHGLTREQMLDPNTAIPFAAQLFSKMVQQTGGNVEEALMRYKGATSEKGRAAMSKPIGDILSGLTPSATPAAAAPEPFKPAATPAKTADAVAKAASFGTMYGSGTVDASASNPQVQQVLAERQALVQQIQLMEQYGFGERAMQLVPQVRAIDLGLLKAQADQGIYEGTTTGNFSRAMAVLSNFRGQPHQSLDRGDGTHDLYVGGKLVRTGMPAEAMADFLNSNIDPAYRERKAALVAERAKQQMKIEEIVVKAVLDAKGNAEVATIQAMGRIAEEMEKRKGVKATHNTNNNTILVQETDNAGNTRVFLVDPTGTKTEMRGKVVESPQRTQIFGSR